jgi:hypothetical protein
MLTWMVLNPDTHHNPRSASASLSDTMLSGIISARRGVPSTHSR